MVWKDTRSAFALNNRSAHTQRHRLVCPFRPSASRPPVYFGSCSGHFLGAERRIELDGTASGLVDT